MMQAQEGKRRVGIVFGGRSSEHEVSILSASSVFSAIDREKNVPVPFLIDKSGAWFHLESGLDVISDLADPKILSLASGARPVPISDFDSMIDFAFPLLHGPYGEDGTIQGMFEMLGKPYAGCGVAASAIAMDKVFTKEIWSRAGLPVGAYTFTTRQTYGEETAGETARIESLIGYPMFIKPANMGSSVGVSKAHDRAGLEAGVKAALCHDRRVIVEQAIPGREFEIGVVGNAVPVVSSIGEIIIDSVYYDYDSKYRGGGAKLVIPALVPEEVRGNIEEAARKAYMALDGEGFARIDFFYDEENGGIWLNEINTIPGFTRFSMFPLLWQAKGVGYTELIERIIELGYERYNAANHG